MNERIKLLAEQAGIQMFEDRAFGWSVIAGTDHNVQRFAELIVAECVELIDTNVTITAAQTYDEVFVARYDTKELCAKQIREHFGVEE